MLRYNYAQKVLICREPYDIIKLIMDEGVNQLRATKCDRKCRMLFAFYTRGLEQLIEIKKHIRNMPCDGVRFAEGDMNFKPFEKKAWLATPTMHGEELKYMTEAYETNWMSTVGANINEVERIAAEKAEMKYAVGLSCCTARLLLAMAHWRTSAYSAQI